MMKFPLLKPFAIITAGCGTGCFAAYKYYKSPKQDTVYFLDNQKKLYVGFQGKYKKFYFSETLPSETWKPWSKIDIQSKNLEGNGNVSDYLKLIELFQLSICDAVRLWYEKSEKFTKFLEFYQQLNKPHLIYLINLSKKQASIGKYDETIEDIKLLSTVDYGHQFIVAIPKDSDISARNLKKILENHRAPNNNYSAKECLFMVDFVRIQNAETIEDLWNLFQEKKADETNENLQPICAKLVQPESFENPPEQKKFWEFLMVLNTVNVQKLDLDLTNVEFMSLFKTGIRTAVDLLLNAKDFNEKQNYCSNLHATVSKFVELCVKNNANPASPVGEEEIKKIKDVLTGIIKYQKDNSVVENRSTINSEQCVAQKRSLNDHKVFHEKFQQTDKNHLSTEKNSPENFLTPEKSVFKNSDNTNALTAEKPPVNPNSDKSGEPLDAVNSLPENNKELHETQIGKSETNQKLDTTNLTTQIKHISAGNICCSTNKNDDFHDNEEQGSERKKQKLGSKKSEEENGNTDTNDIVDERETPTDIKPSEEKQIFTIVVVGATGVGKSTFISGIANYLKWPEFEDALNQKMELCIPVQFTAMKRGEPNQIVRAGFTDGDEKKEDFNENFNDLGHSITQKPQIHSFEFEEKIIRVIDTPGLEDTRGNEQDEENLKMIQEIIEDQDEVHGICIVLKSNQQKLTPEFEMTIRKLLSLFPKTALNNVFFFLTFSVGTFFAVGDVMNPLKSLQDKLKKTHDKTYSVEANRLYCIDSESFKYVLCRERMIHYENKPDMKFKFAWDESAKQIKEFFTYFQKVEPVTKSEIIASRDLRESMVKLTEIQDKIPEDKKNAFSEYFKKVKFFTKKYTMIINAIQIHIEEKDENSDNLRLVIDLSEIFEKNGSEIQTKLNELLDKIDILEKYYNHISELKQQQKLKENISKNSPLQIVNGD